MRHSPTRAHRPRKRFGQHFLHDRGVLAKIVDAIAPQPGDAILEIGPGEGALTRLLLERVPRLRAIEIDRDLAARLAAQFAPQRLALERADALDFDFAALPAGTRLVGNLPYNISTPLLFRIADCAARLRDAHFMLQREVAARMVARPSAPDYGRLSVMLQARFAMRLLLRVPSGAFRPPPKVESALVRLEPLAAPAVCDAARFADVVRRAFSARRKTLRNALPEVDFAALGIDPGLRPENLSAADYARIAAPPGRQV
jgi:16S rRNA (adenine1518-N6/adenine1519-N6)-dimethyltransferase